MGPGDDGDVGDDGDQGDDGPEGDEGVEGDCGCEKRPTTCKSCDVHVVTRHSQTTEIPDCPAGFKSLWTGFSLVMLEGNGYSLAQELGSAGSCLEEFQPVPMMQCSGGKVCSHGVRTDKAFYLANEQNPDFAIKPESNLDDLIGYVSRCSVCGGSSKILARHSFTSDVPECPEGFHEIWEGYSYLMVTSSGASGGGQTLASAGSCVFYINNIDYWLAQNPDISQPGMWGMGNVYSGINEILDMGVARCAVCAADVRMKHTNYFKD